MFRVDSVEAKPVERETPQVKVKPPEPQVENVAPKTKDAELRFAGANFRHNLDAKFAQDVSPSKALDKINALPKPNILDQAAIREYKQQRAEIADNSIRNSQPPRRGDFKGLNPRIAEMEYRDSLSGYSTQITDLKKVSAEAKAYPDKILSPFEAADQINKLPRPDRSNPQAIQTYNRQRADLADAALMYAKPPTRDDFKGLPPNLAGREFSDALSSYNSSVSQLTEASNARYSSVPPPMTDAEADKAAQDIINRHGGAKMSQDDAAAAGRDLAELAKQNPQDAAAVGNKVLEKLAGKDRGDDVSRALVENLSIDELRAVAKTPEGAAFLENAKNNLVDGKVNSKEADAAQKTSEAQTGFNPQSLTGNPEDDAKTVDQQLKNLPPELRESYVKELLQDPYGQQAMRFSSLMSLDGQKALGQALGSLYQKNPTEIGVLLRRVTDTPQTGSYPLELQSGMALVVAQSGNDDLIKSFAQHEIDRVKGTDGEIRGYLNAVTAWSGLSPDGLQDLMKSNPDFYKAVEEAGKLTEGPGASAGFLNPNIFEPGLGDLLKKASQITDANGNSTPEALKLFATAAKYGDDNIFTKQGLGAFFIEHAKQVVDTYTDPRSKDFNPEVLQTFFSQVVYSPLSKDLQYNGKPLVEQIVGDKNGNGGVVGDVVQSYLDEAKAPNDTEKGRENDHFLGQKIGYLWGAMSAGLLDSVQAYKDQWNDDKEFRDFAFDMLGKGLGKLADKFGLPGEAVDIPLSITQKIVEAGKEDDKDKQLDKFKEIFGDLSTLMFNKVTAFEADTPNVEGLQGGYLEARSDYLLNYLINDWIKD